MLAKLDGALTSIKGKLSECHGLKFSYQDSVVTR